MFSIGTGNQRGTCLKFEILEQIYLILHVVKYISILTEEKNKLRLKLCPAQGIEIKANLSQS